MGSTSKLATIGTLCQEKDKEEEEEEKRKKVKVKGAEERERERGRDREREGQKRERERERRRGDWREEREGEREGVLALVGTLVKSGPGPHLLFPSSFVRMPENPSMSPWYSASYCGYTPSVVGPQLAAKEVG